LQFRALTSRLCSLTSRSIGEVRMLRDNALLKRMIATGE
jgi:hypothetical protein